MNRILEAIKNGTAVYLEPHKEPKIWGIGGIGEYWYGAEKGEKSSIAVVGGNTAPMADIIESIPESVLGRDVIKKFGQILPLVKVLTPKARLSVQFHDAKNELWIITGIDKKIANDKPNIILGFNPEAVKKYAETIKQEYKKTLEEYGRALNQLIDVMEKKGYKEGLDKAGDVIKAAEFVKNKDLKIDEGLLALNLMTKRVAEFYSYRQISIGDVIPIPAGTLHALGAGIEIVEPQIPGPTQSLEDGATYPVRYYFPGHNRPGAQKRLDIDRVGEMCDGIVEENLPEIISEESGCKIERLPGKFENKGLEVHRISVKKNRELHVSKINSFHSLVLIEGEAKVLIKMREYDVPKVFSGGKMLLIPACAGDFRIKTMEKEACIIDTFTPA
ncbi:MAG: type I phosphomannose isomerase catalytic subunit [Candidatus Omnitrophota bacterium]